MLVQRRCAIVMKFSILHHLTTFLFQIWTEPPGMLRVKNSSLPSCVLVCWGIFENFQHFPVLMTCKYVTIAGYSETVNSYVSQHLDECDAVGCGMLDSLVCAKKDQYKKMQMDAIELALSCGMGVTMI